MSNEFNVAVKLQADASQYTAEFTRAGRTAAAFAAELNGGSSAAAGGLDKATAQAQRFGATASAAASQAQQGMAAATSATQALDTAVAKVHKTASSTQLGASLGAVAKESQSASQALGAADRQAQALGISAKQTAAAMRGVPAQITDKRESMMTHYDPSMDDDDETQSPMAAMKVEGRRVMVPGKPR